MNAEQQTFRSLHILEQCRNELKEKLKEEYAKKTLPFLQIINRIMRVKNVDHFEATKLIKENLSIYQKPGADIFFAAALMEIVEENNLKELK